MKVFFTSAVWLAAALPAVAQDWQEYRVPEMGFAVSFPGTPVVTDTVYKNADGTTESAKFYSLRQGQSEFRIIVADFTNSPVQDDAAIDQADKALSATGQVAVDIPARVNRNYGRQLSITTQDGSHSVSAIFFVNHRLYQIEGITHPGDNANSSSAVRFQQSLNFLGGFGGRRDFGGRYFGPGGG
jgi:hypothetical protein